MSDSEDPHNLREKSDRDLAEWLSGWKEGSKEYIFGSLELERRKNRGNTTRGWVAIGISVIALIVSIVALFTNRGS